MYSANMSEPTSPVSVMAKRYATWLIVSNRNGTAPRQQRPFTNRLRERSKPVPQERAGRDPEPSGAIEMLDMTARADPNGIRPPFEPIRNLLRHISLSDVHLSRPL